MKKIFTFLFVAAAALVARATDYTVPMVITVNGESVEQVSTISITENEGLYDVNLKNFMLASEDGPMPVGNIELKGIAPQKEADATLLLTTGLVDITEGDDPSIPLWMASVLPPVNVLLNGKIHGDHIRFFIDIDLTETLQQKIQVEIGDGYQLANRSFETWHTSTSDNVEPNAWHSFESATGSMAAMATMFGTHIGMSDDAHSGSASARIFATSIIGIVANGTMTTGRMNAGSATATDVANHAYIDMSSTDVDGNGDPYYSPMYAYPDSIAVWVKFKQGTPNASHPYATISAVITDGTYYQDPEDKEYSNVIGKAKNSTIAETGDEWVRVTAPFVYSDAALALDPKAVLITISTNAAPGQGSGNDEVLVDDISFIYNAKVTGIKIKGQSVPDFNPEVRVYNMEINEELTFDDITFVAEGNSVHSLKYIEPSDEGYTCYFVALSGDMITTNLYVVNVKSTATAIQTISAPASQSAVYYTLDGIHVQAPQSGKIYICRKADGTVTKVLK